MGHCNHSLPFSIYHSPHVKHSLSLLSDFSWPQTPALLYHWEWKASWSTAVLKNSILQSPLSLICRTNLWIESVSGMDGAWWMFSGSTISSDLGAIIIDGTNLWQHEKVLWVMDHNLAWLYFSENDVFDGSVYAIHRAFAMDTHCRTSAMTYSRTLFLIIVEK